MNRLPIFWVPAPDPDDDVESPDRYICVRIREDWVSVDDDQLILPVSLLERDGETIGNEPGILKQYGGEALLNDLLMSEQDVEPGTEWIIGHEEHRGRYIQPVD